MNWNGYWMEIKNKLSQLKCMKNFWSKSNKTNAKKMPLFLNLNLAKIIIYFLPR